MARSQNVAVLTALAIRLGVTPARLRVAMEELGRRAGEPPRGGPAIDIARELDLPTSRVRVAMAAVSGSAQTPPAWRPAAPPTLTAIPR